MRDDCLFTKLKLREFLENREQEMMQEIDAIEGNRLLNTSIEDLCDYFEEKYRIEMLKLKEDQTTADQREVNVDVSQDPARFIRDRSKPRYIKGTQVTFYTPFEGESNLLQCMPDIYTLNPPRATIRGNELLFHYQRTDHDAEAIKREFNDNLSSIHRYLKWIEPTVSQFNASIRDKARKCIQTRCEKLLKDQGLVSALGFPLRQRDDAPRTYVVPIARRKISPVMPQASTAPFVPEPTLDMQEYERILSVIRNMVDVIERSPKAFKRMREEDLRNHFLVQLNGQYEGQATGETFNFEGKTDILIRVEGKNIFIAECKLWRGPESLTEALNQLLNYASWRDTKIALLLFNRNKNLSGVLEQIPKIIQAHPNFKRQVKYDVEAGFRFILHHRDDPNRELTLTVLVFEVPG
jgi:hypothetical protein